MIWNQSSLFKIETCEKNARRQNKAQMKGKVPACRSQVVLSSHIIHIVLHARSGDSQVMKAWGVHNKWEGCEGYTTCGWGVYGFISPVCKATQNSENFLSINQVLSSVYRTAGPNMELINEDSSIFLKWTFFLITELINWHSKLILAMFMVLLEEMEVNITSFLLGKIIACNFCISFLNVFRAALFSPFRLLVLRNR